MFKKTLIAVAAIAASAGVAFANGGSFVAAPTADHNFAMYVGANISRDVSNYRFDFSDASGNLVTRTDLGADGIDGGVFVGAGMTFANHYYMGLEGFFDASSNDAEFLGASIKNTWDAGIDFVPGIKITDSTMLYGKVGYVNGEFKGISSSDTSDHEHRSGLQAGLGFQAMVTQNIGLRGEWAYNHYEKQSFSDGLGNTTSFRPSMDQFKFGILYNFNVA